MSPTSILKLTRGGPTARFLSAAAAASALAILPLRSAAAEAAEPANQEAVLERCTKILKYGDLTSMAEPSKVDAVHALGLIGNAKALPLLIEHLENERNDNLRMQIVRSLGWIGSKDAVPALEKSLADKYPFVRQQSAVALKKITGKDYEYDKTGLPDPTKLREMIEKTKKTASRD